MPESLGLLAEKQEKFMCGCKQWKAMSLADMSYDGSIYYTSHQGALECPYRNVKWVYLQTGSAPQVPCSSTISSHKAEIFTGLLVSNKLLSEMKVQLQPYETECPD